MEPTSRDGRSRARRTWRRAVGLVAIVSACGALVACGSDDDTPSTTDDSATSAPVPGTDGSGSTTPDSTDSGEQPVAGGTLTYLHYTETKGFDPAIGQPNSQFAIQNYAIYDALTYESPADLGVHLRILESGESTDGTTWTLKIKPGVEFSDGTPLDAEAVKFNWERLADPATAAVSGAAAQTIATYEVVDPTTLKVTLKAPNGQFLRTIAASALTWIGSPTAIQADPAGFNTKPVGAGPYTLEEWVPNDHATLAKNPNYYGTTYVDEFIVRVVPDETQRLSTLQSGGGDVLRTLSGITAANADDAGFEFNTTSPAGGYVLFFNTQKAPFDDLRVRKAFSLAVDGQAIVDAVYEGKRTAATNVFPETSPFYDAKYDQPEPNDEEAQALFDEYVAEHGPIDVRLSYVNVFEAEAQWFQTKMAGFDGVKVSLAPDEVTQFQAAYSTGQVQFGWASYNLIDAGDLTRVLATKGALNYAQVSDPKIDEALKAGVAEVDQDARPALYAPVLQYILDEVPFTFVLRQQSWEYFDGDKVHGITPESQRTAAGGLMIDQVWVTE